MKKLLYLILLISGSVFAQAPTSDSTKLTAPPIVNSTTPQFYYRGGNASNMQIGYFVGGKWGQLVTGYQFNQYIGTATAAAIAAVAPDSTRYTTLHRYLYGLDTLYNKNTYSQHLIGINNVSVATPANGVNIFGDAFANTFGYKGANGFAALFNNANLTGTRLYRLPDVNSGTFAVNNTNNAFTAAQTMLYTIANTAISGVTTPSAGTLAFGYNSANTFAFKGANGYTASFSGNGLTTSRAYILPDISGGTFAVTNTDNAFSTPQSMTGLVIFGSAGQRNINLSDETPASVNTPSGAINFYGTAGNSIGWKNTSGFNALISSSTISADRTFTLPNASTALVGESTTGPVTISSGVSSLGKNIALNGGTASGWHSGKNSIEIDGNGDAVFSTSASTQIGLTRNGYVTGPTFSTFTRKINGNAGYINIANGGFFTYNFLGYGASGAAGTPINVFSVDSLGNQINAGTITASISAGAANDFVVSNAGKLEKRTAAQTLSDIGAVGTSATAANSTLWNNETITTAAKASGDVMQYDGSKWVNATVSVTAPLQKSGAGAGGTWSITKADATHDGYVSSTDWNTFNGKADLASPTFTTPTLGVASATSLSVTGTAGAGFVALAPQSSTPSTPASGVVIYNDNSANRVSFLGANGFASTFTFNGNTAARVYTFPNSNASLAPLASPTFTGTVNVANITATGTQQGPLYVVTGTSINPELRIAPLTSGTALLSMLNAGGSSPLFGYQGILRIATVTGSGGAGSVNTMTFDASNNVQVVNKLSVGAALNLKNYTVATLPAGTQGDVAYVTDALAPSFLVTVVGGGSVVTPVFYNGTTWVAQ